VYRAVLALILVTAADSTGPRAADQSYAGVAAALSQAPACGKDARAANSPKGVAVVLYILAASKVDVVSRLRFRRCGTCRHHVAVYFVSILRVVDPVPAGWTSSR